MAILSRIIILPLLFLTPLFSAIYLAITKKQGY